MDENNVWTRHLDQNTKDIYDNYKESINFKLTNLTATIAHELMSSGLDYTPEVANKMAINLLMEQLLSLQYEHAPASQKVMVVNLFVALPEAQDIRMELMEKLNENLKKNNSPKF